MSRLGGLKEGWRGKVSNYSLRKKMTQYRLSTLQLDFPENKSLCQTRGVIKHKIEEKPFDLDLTRMSIR